MTPYYLYKVEGVSIKEKVTLFIKKIKYSKGIDVSIRPKHVR